MHVLDVGEVCESGILMKTSEAGTAQFERLLAQHAGIVRKVAFGYARNENDRRDLIQDILLQLWKAYPRYSAERPFSTWMYRIALNVAISGLRKQSRPGGEPLPFDESAHDLPHEGGSSTEMEERITTLPSTNRRMPTTRSRSAYALPRRLLLPRNRCRLGT